MRKGIYGLPWAACARALFWAWPNSARHRVWPRPGGSYRCTKVGVPQYPELVHGQSQRPAARLDGRPPRSSVVPIDAIQEQSVLTEKTKPRQEELAGKANQGTTKNLP